MNLGSEGIQGFGSDLMKARHPEILTIVYVSKRIKKPIMLIILKLHTSARTHYYAQPFLSPEIIVSVFNLDSTNHLLVWVIRMMGVMSMAMNRLCYKGVK
jgi:hypothetical protein